MTVVLGIDPGVSTGLALIRLDEERWELVRRWQVEGSLRRLYAELLELRPDVVVTERNYPLAQPSALANAERLGIVRLVVEQQGLTMHELHPSTIRQQVVGDGRAKAVQVRRAVRDLCGIPGNPGKGKGLSDHQADAIAVALAYVLL